MPLLTVKELAEAISVSETTVLRMARAGEIPAERYRDCWRFDLGKVRAARQVEPEPVKPHGSRHPDPLLVRRVCPWPTKLMKVGR